MYICNMLLNVMLFSSQLSRLLWNMYDYYVRGRGDTGTSLWSGILAYVPTWAYFVFEMYHDSNWFAIIIILANWLSNEL